MASAARCGRRDRAEDQPAGRQAGAALAAGRRAEAGHRSTTPKCPTRRCPAQRVAFGTSGHRGSALECSFNEAHVLAITQAICHYRKQHGIDGPLFIGIDTHALSQPAYASALEVLAANGVEVMLAEGDEYTPTPAVSHAILVYNQGRRGGLADGIVITPSHNPPDNGGFKYNPPNGGPAETDVTALDRGQGQRAAGGGPGRRRQDVAGKGAARRHHSPARLSRRLRRRSGERDRHGCDSRRRRSHGRRSAGRRRRALLGPDRRALWLEPDGRQ